MKTKTPTGIGSLPITTEPQPVLISREMAEEHARLLRAYERVRKSLSQRRGRPGKALLEEEEVARANLRAFERKNGLNTP